MIENKECIFSVIGISACHRHEVLQVAVMVTAVVQMIFVIFSVVDPQETVENIIWAKLTVTIALILVMVVSALKIGTRILRM